MDDKYILLVPYYDSYSNQDAFPICADPLIEAFFTEPYTITSPDPELETAPDPEPETESHSHPEPEDDQ